MDKHLDSLHYFAKTNNAAMNDFVFVCVCICIYIFALSEVYFQDKFVDVTLLGQMITAYIVLFGIPKLPSEWLHQFAFLPTIC